jgi:hypothetical protein
MRLTAIATVVAVTATTLLASGCGSGTNTNQAAITACDYFESWMGATTGGDPLDTQYTHYLTQALNAAPSGTLHNDLSTLVADAKQAVADPNLPAAIAGDAADIVNNDCSSVLPSVSPLSA